jgi:hypothetical protein
LHYSNNIRAPKIVLRLIQGLWCLTPLKHHNPCMNCNTIFSQLIHGCKSWIIYYSFCRMSYAQTSFYMSNQCLSPLTLWVLKLHFQWAISAYHHLRCEFEFTDFRRVKRSERYIYCSNDQKLIYTMQLCARSYIRSKSTIADKPNVNTFDFLVPWFFCTRWNFNLATSSHTQILINWTVFMVFLLNYSASVC